MLTPVNFWGESGGLTTVTRTVLPCQVSKATISGQKYFSFIFMRQNKKRKPWGSAAQFWVRRCPSLIVAPPGTWHSNRLHCVLMMTSHFLCSPCGCLLLCTEDWNWHFVLGYIMLHSLVVKKTQNEPLLRSCVTTSEMCSADMGCNTPLMVCALF